MWSIWDKKSEINGFTAEFFFERNKYMQKEETIFIKTVNGRVTQVEGKNILASVYGINPYLNDWDFIADYERIITSVENTEE